MEHRPDLALTSFTAASSTLRGRRWFFGPTPNRNLVKQWRPRRCRRDRMGEPKSRWDRSPRPLFTCSKRPAAAYRSCTKRKCPDRVISVFQRCFPKLRDTNSIIPDLRMSEAVRRNMVNIPRASLELCLVRTRSRQRAPGPPMPGYLPRWGGPVRIVLIRTPAQLISIH